jgi:uncharacterized membrane protein YGL010W
MKLMSTLPSSALLIYFKDYEQFHQTKGNKITHLAGIPFVLFSLVGLLSLVTLWSPAASSLFKIDLGLLLILFGSAFALRVDYKLGIPFSLYIYLNYLLARQCPLSVLIAVQILGWALQLFGHFKYEKKSPAFLTSMEHLFIGPMWIFSWVIGYYKPTAK